MSETKYRRYAKNLKKVLKNEEIAYYSKKFLTSKKCSKSTWKNINEILHPNAKPPQKSFLIDNSSTDDAKNCIKFTSFSFYINRCQILSSY